jgi:hypothetical protein
MPSSAEVAPMLSLSNAEGPPSDQAWEPGLLGIIEINTSLSRGGSHACPEQCRRATARPGEEPGLLGKTLNIE